VLASATTFSTHQPMWVGKGDGLELGCGPDDRGRSNADGGFAVDFAASRSTQSTHRSTKIQLSIFDRLFFLLEPVDLTLQHTNHTVLVEGPEITIRPVGTRRLVPGDSR
jgi:hypothetical protein